MSFKVEVDGKQVEVFTEEEINQKVKESVESARKNEKDKLYSRIEELEKKAKESVEAAANLAKEKEEVEKKVMEEKERLEREKLSEIDRLKQDFKKSTDEIMSKVQEVSSKNEELAKNLKIKELEAVKSSIIAESNGEIIAEMITGSTPEEMRESAEKAKNTYKSLKEKFTPQPETPTQTPEVKPTTINPPTPPISEGGSNAPLTPEVIAAMTPEEYLKHRTLIMKTVNSN